MAQRAPKSVKPTKPRHRAKDSRDYEPPVVPIEAIHEAASELRADHPQVTDEQAHFVHLIVQTGKPPAALAKMLGLSKHWAYYNMSKAAVADYRQALSLRVLGWDSAAALATMRSLLTSKSDYIKLEAARDLLDRAGMSLEPAVPRTAPISLTFNLNPMAQSAAGNKASAEPAVIEGDVVTMAQATEMGPVEPSQNGKGPLKNEAGVQGRGKHAYDQGVGVTSDEDDPFTA
jgi:hypothetical protein